MRVITIRQDCECRKCEVKLKAKSRIVQIEYANYPYGSKLKYCLKCGQKIAESTLNDIILEGGRNERQIRE